MYIPTGSELLDPGVMLARAGVREGMHVADLGAGATGHVVFAAAHMVGKSGLVYAVDILKSALAGVESRAKLEGITNVRTVWSDIEVFGATEIPEASLDVCTLVNNRVNEAMLRESMRLTKPGGIVLVVDWVLTDIPFGPPTKERVDPAHVKELAKSLHLTEVEEFAAGQYHYGFVFQK